MPITFGLILIPGYQGFTWYEVVPGDTLSDLAKRFLTDADRYPILAEANRDSVSDPNSILVGQQLPIRALVSLQRLPDGARVARLPPFGLRDDFFAIGREQLQALGYLAQ